MLPKVSKTLIPTIITTACIMSIIISCGTTESEDLAFDLVISDRKLNVEKIKARQGDNVTLNITSYETGTVHIHGYDLEENVQTEDVAKLFFEAHITGKFNIAFHPLTEHNEGTESVGKHALHQQDHDHKEDHKENELIIGSLEVYPR